MKLCVQSAVYLPTKFNENTILYIHTYHTVFSILVYHHCKTKVGSTLPLPHVFSVTLGYKAESSVIFE